MGQIVSLLFTHVPRTDRLRIPMAASNVRGAGSSTNWVYRDPHPLAYNSIHELACGMYTSTRP